MKNSAKPTRRDGTRAEYHAWPASGFPSALFIASISCIIAFDAFLFGNAISRLWDCSTTFLSRRKKRRSMHNQPVYVLLERKRGPRLRRRLRADIIIARGTRRGVLTRHRNDIHGCHWQMKQGALPIISTSDTRSKAPLVTLQVATRCCYANFYLTWQNRSVSRDRQF